MKGLRRNLDDEVRAGQRGRDELHRAIKEAEKLRCEKEALAANIQQLQGWLSSELPPNDARVRLMEAEGKV